MARNYNNKGKPQASNNKSKVGNNKRRSSGYKSRREDNSAREHLKDAINDIEWYAKNPQLLKDAASVPFSQMLGLEMNYGGYDGTFTSPIRQKLPGLVLLPIVPCFGTSGDSTSVGYAGRAAINVAAQNIYSFVRHQNGGHANYDAPDLMVYIMAMDQLYSYHAELARLYGVMRFYSGYNRYLGRYLVEALGYDYDDLVSNLAQLRYTINTMAAKISTFAVPAVFPMFERHRNIYSSIYMDQASVKAQCYAFIPAYRGVYNEPVDAQGHKVPYKVGLIAKTIGWGPSTLRTLSDIENSITEMLSPLLYSEDIGIMSGDILKAYGVEKCYSINALPDDWTVGPVYVPTVLKQIHNSVTIGSPDFNVQDGNSMMMWQNGTNPLIFTWSDTNSIIPVMHGANLTPGSAIKKIGVTMNPHVLDTDEPSPSCEEVMEITRLAAMPTWVNKPADVATRPLAANGITVDAFISEGTYNGLGADAVVCYLVYNGNLDSNDRPYWTILHSHTVVVDGNEGDQFNTYRNALSAISKFHWHPTLYEYGVNATVFGASGSVSASDIRLRVTSDLDNCVMISTETLARLHDVALLSLLDVPTTTLSKGI